MSHPLGIQITRGVASIGLARATSIAIDGLCYILVARFLGPDSTGNTWR